MKSKRDTKVVNIPNYEELIKGILDEAYAANRDVMEKALQDSILYGTTPKIEMTWDAVARNIKMRIVDENE